MIEGPISEPPGPASRRPSRTTSSSPAAAASIASAMRSRASGPTSGQTSTPSWSPGPTPRSAAAAASAREAAVLLGGGADEDRDRAGEAALAAGAEGRRHDRRHGHLEVGVGHHDERVLRPAQRLEALAGAGRALGDVARGRRLADERDRVDLGVVEQAVDRVAGAVDEVEDAVGELVDRVDQLEDQLRRARVALRRLEDEGVAAGDREGQEPERDHRREVERGDRADHADRLAHELDVDARGDALEVLALEQVRDPAGGLGRLDPAQDLAAGVVRASCPCPR